MESAKRRVRSPLLWLVYGTAVTLAVIIGAALMVVVEARFADAVTTSTLNGDRELVRAFIASHLTPADLEAPIGEQRRAELTRALANLTAPAGLIHVAVYNETERSVASSAAGDKDALSGTAQTALAAALAGDVQSSVVDGPDGSLLREYVPVFIDGKVRAVAVLDRDASVFLTAAGDVRRDVVLVAGTGMLLLVGLLFLIFRAAHERLARQSRALVEAASRDPLTGLPNHGAVVALVTEALADAARQGGWLVAALVDVDNFSLFNTTHGHVAGDQVLLTIAQVLRDEAPAGVIVGRYGPDEFLISGPAAVAHEVRPTVARIRERLGAIELATDTAERVPVTISAGIANYPEHAGAITELLAAAALTLREAKVGGGDTIRVETVPGEESAEEARSFGVLRGLVTAVDNKDHYTMRHSEEVANYALLLAGELGLDEESCGALRLAALLHDVGKIGIPDSILRKPGPFTDEERQVMAQHTLIGDLIIRGLPRLEVVAASVRAHHERWDGAGYPDGLRGEEIPRLARFVSVADAFSAMTSSRSYRVRLPVAEALDRIMEGAGTQFDAYLATAFVELIERRPDSILKDTDMAAERVWMAAAELDEHVA